MRYQVMAEEARVVQKIFQRKGRVAIWSRIGWNRRGMRWTLPGAQAMLHIRALYLNDQWDDFLEYRIEQEQTRLYGGVAA